MNSGILRKALRYKAKQLLKAGLKRPPRPLLPGARLSRPDYGEPVDYTGRVDQLARAWKKAYREAMPITDEKSNFHAIHNKEGKPVAFVESFTEPGEYKPIRPLRGRVLEYVESHAPGAGRHLIRHLQRTHDFLESEPTTPSGAQALEDMGFRQPKGGSKRFVLTQAHWRRPKMPKEHQALLDRYVRSISSESGPVAGKESVTAPGD